jgi:hypothetical protein
LVRRIIIHILVVLFILLLGASPFIATMIAGTIADANGCVLHEGFVNPCIINGEDRGDDLYTIGMLGFFAIGTIPLAVMVAVGYILIIVIIAIIQSARRRRAANDLQLDAPPPAS